MVALRKPDLKKCTKCEAWKSLAEGFHKRVASPDGRKTICKDCLHRPGSRRRPGANVCWGCGGQAPGHATGTMQWEPRSSAPCGMCRRLFWGHHDCLEGVKAAALKHEATCDRVVIRRERLVCE
jgi:hypothetical protein